MSVPPSYFEYPWRRKGLDHDRFPDPDRPQPVELVRHVLLNGLGGQVRHVRDGPR